MCDTLKGKLQVYMYVYTVNHKRSDAHGQVGITWIDGVTSPPSVYI